MKALLGRFEPQIYAIFRIVFGLLFMLHGTQKIFGWPMRPTPPGGGGGGAMPAFDPFSLMGIAGIIELVGGALIVIGLFGSIVAFIASGEMAVAFFKAHAPQGPIPLINGGEAATLFCFALLYIAARGSGIWSVDAAMARSRQPSS